MDILIPICIFHTNDSLEEATELQFELTMLGYWVNTLADLTKGFAQKEIYNALAEPINWKILIALSSKGLFDDKHFVEAAQIAFEDKVLIPVVFGHEKVEQPYWFRNPINLTAIHGADSPREWTRLIEVLNRRTGLSCLYEPPKPKKDLSIN